MDNTSWTFNINFLARKQNDFMNKKLSLQKRNGKCFVVVFYVKYLLTDILIYENSCNSNENINSNRNIPLSPSMLKVKYSSLAERRTNAFLRSRKLKLKKIAVSTSVVDPVGFYLDLSLEKKNWIQLRPFRKATRSGSYLFIYLFFFRHKIL